MFSENLDQIEPQEPISLEDGELTAIQRVMAGASARTFTHEDWLVTLTKSTLLTGFELRLVLFNQVNGTRYLYCYDELGNVFHCEGVRYPVRQDARNPTDPMGGYSVPTYIAVDQGLPKLIIDQLENSQSAKAVAA
jgi:hypothetical protein